MTEICPGCKGSGHIIIDCPYCRQADDANLTKTKKTCPCCNNKGYFEDVCHICRGKGIVEIRKAV